MAFKYPPLEKVFEPIKIGEVELKNRFIRMGAMRNFQPDGGPSNVLWEPWFDYMESLAAGGFGLVSVGGADVHFNFEGTEIESNIVSDWDIPTLKRISDAIHKHGAKAFHQIVLWMPTSSITAPGAASYASSELTKEDLKNLIPYSNPPKALTKEYIKQIIHLYAETAAKLQEAGFDGMEINAAHSHGLNSFLSPAWNKRTDEYGGSPENRCRILCEINQAVKERCGSKFALINNLSGCEFNLEGGQRLPDVVEIVQYLEKSGADAFHIRYEVYHPAIEELGLPRNSHESPDIDLYPSFMDGDLSEFGIDHRFGKGIAGWSGCAAAVKKVVNVPVSVSGRMDAFVGEQLIREGNLDLVNMCRRAVADPNYCNKVIEGRAEDIRPCVGCYTCYDYSERGLISECMVNPTLYKGKEYGTLTPADQKKRVLIIGGGAAGLESARVAALRGHEVILCEHEKSLGGSLPLAALIKGFHEDFLEFSKWQVRQVEKLGVDVRLKTNVDEKLIEKINPDVIVCAVGGGENTPDIPGINNKIVVTSESLHKLLRKATKFFNVETLGKLSKIAMPGVGKNVVLIGGSIFGIQTAHFLIEHGRNVIVLEESSELGAGMIDCGPRQNMLRWLYDNNIEMHRNVQIKEITDKGVVYINEEGKEVLAKGDTVMPVLPMTTNLDLYERIKDKAPEVYAIGDCNPREANDENFPPLKLEPFIMFKPHRPSFTCAAINEAYRIMHTV